MAIPKCIDDQQDWIECLDSILLAYNTKLDSTLMGERSFVSKFSLPSYIHAPK